MAHAARRRFGLEEALVAPAAGPPAGPAPAAEEEEAKLWSHGDVILKNFLAIGVSELPSADRAKLVDFLTCNPDTTIGSMCSGTEAPILAVSALKQAIEHPT